MGMVVIAGLCPASVVAQDEQHAPPPLPVWQRLFARPQSIPAPATNPSTAAKIALGKRLFGDERLSGGNGRSCVTCHDPAQGYSDGRRKPLGIDGQPLLRNAPALWNLAWARHLYWDGRQPTLEAQARIPIEHPNEMAGNLTRSAAVLNGDVALRGLFADAFPRDRKATPSNILAALAAFERSLVSPETPFDRWIAGDRTALSMAAYRGFVLFTGRAGCLACHGGWRFTDDRFHDIGLATSDKGRSAIDGSKEQAPRFKTPGLREAVFSAPYMHDGSKATLAEVLDHYAGGVAGRASVAANIVRNHELSAPERAEMIAFLKSLSSDTGGAAPTGRDIGDR
jgi:cytochrome c peroxidase